MPLFIHVFPYSRKAGTLADKMEGHIDPRIKKARVKQVMELEKGYTGAYHQTFIGKSVKVLVEKNDDRYSYGYSREYIYTKIEGNLEVGELYDVIVDRIENDEVIGHAA